MASSPAAPSSPSSSPPSSSSSPSSSPWSPASARGRVVALSLAVAALLLLGLAVHWSHLQDGGFHGDDWGFHYRYEVATEQSGSAVLRAADGLYSTLGGRPLQALAVMVPHALFDRDFSAHLLWALAIACAAAVLFFFLLRSLGLPPLACWIVAALTLVFPFNDATRLWVTGSTANIATCFALLGLLIALRGLRLHGGRAVAVHAAAVACYVASALTYEATAALLVLSGLLYLVKANWSAVRARWAVDAVAVIAVIGWSYERTRDVRPTVTLSAFLRDSLTFGWQEIQQVARAILPADVPRAVQVLAAAFVVGAAASAYRSERRWLVVAVAGAFALAASCVPFIGSGLHPLDPGEYNRVNVVAALPIAALVAGLVLAATRASRGGLYRVAGIVLLVLIGAQYAHVTRQDIARWDAASADQQRVLANLRRALPSPRPGTIVYSFGAPATTTPGVFVFSSTSDLSSAVNLGIWRGKRADAFPVTKTTRMVCEADRVVPVSGPSRFNSNALGFGPGQGGRYGRVVFVDAASGARRAIGDRAACASALATRFVPGPLVGRL